MYDKERFILKSHFPPSLIELNEIGKTIGWTSKAYRTAARDYTLERNSDVVGRGLQLQHVTDDTNWFTPTYKETPEWHDAIEAPFDERG